jgi:pimeloyl-ACP methyl ester carboxylesterase
VERFSECVADLIAAFELGRVHLLGHSMGGAVALSLAAQHPELVQRLVLVAPLAYPFLLRGMARLPLWPVVGPVLFKQLYGRAMFRAYFRDDVYAPGFLLNTPRLDTLYDKFNVPAARESAYATLKTLQDMRVTTARLGRVRAPTLVVWGRNDEVSHVQNAQRLVKDLLDARLRLLECGHAPQEERPTELVNVVAEFLEGAR